ncbi:MAG: ligase-associated DNA damage response exonuclease [Bacteroidia bacterium]
MPSPSETSGLPAWLELRPAGLYCVPGDFYLDPWAPVARAVITHAHSDHARRGSEAYLCAAENAPLLRHRLGNIRLQTLAWGETLSQNGLRLSLHPAGHIRGSAQVRLEYRGEVWVFTGDYKRWVDPTTAPFEPIRAHGLISESTFGLPIYQWSAPAEVMAAIVAWWESCRKEGKNALLYAYTLGKAQRILALLSEAGPCYVHKSIAAINYLYEQAGVKLGKWQVLVPEALPRLKGALCILPPAAQKARWLSQLEPYEEAQASGWMAVRGRRRQKALDRGFPLSDHADFYQILQTVREVQPERVIFTHGYTEAMADYLRWQGYAAYAWRSRYEGEA